jgi:protein-S-isoprenylcysteine O-methyltransferase Ste14
MLELSRAACLALFALMSLVVLDAPLRTFGQRYQVSRSRERFILLTFELDLVVLWAIAVFYFHWDRWLLPRSLESALAPAGSLVTLAGATLAAWARLRLGRWFTATFGVKVGHELVTDGPYGVTRHPMYTGLLLMVLGAALAWDSALTLLLALLLVVPFFFHTVYEEALFERHFGEAYFDYERRVPRLVPFVPTRRGGRDGRGGGCSPAEPSGRQV